MAGRVEQGRSPTPGPLTTSLEVASSGQQVLLATKLHLPQPPPGFTPRPRLVDRLNEGLARGLVLVCAPAGFGKTALLADWAHRHHGPVAWLSLDSGDSDPARFWRHVAAALDRARPGLAEQVAPLLGPPAPASFEALATMLVNELASQPGEGVALVLDDYHVVDAQPVHASLAFLLEHRPPGLQLVLASRADPPLRLARLRSRGQLAELRAADLRFSPEEAAGLLRAAVGPDLPVDAMAALAARTEGWAAGLQLAALSLRGQADVAGFVAGFSGSHRYVLDFLAEEVLDRQPDEVRAFLLGTSVLERLSGPLCDAVCGRTGSQATLEELERANLFLVPLDEVRGWWRYHQLFADLLRARLAQQHPERVPELHRAAAAWYERNGLADDAVRHALAAGDAAWAARLIELHVDALLLRGERGTLERWVAALPGELVGSRPRLLLAQADLALSAGRVEAVEHALDGAERAFADAPDELYQPSVDRAASLVANVPAAIAFWRAYLAELRGDAEGAIAFDRKALAELGEEESVLASVARLHLRSAELLRGVPPDAERAFASSMAELRVAGEVYPALRACELLGHVQRAQGRLDAALGTYRQGLKIAAPTGGPPPPVAGMAHVGLAEVAYQRNDLEAALEHASEGIALCRQLAYPRSLAAGLATLARIRQAEGDLSGALDAIQEDWRVAPSRGVTGLLNPVPALRARLRLAQGDLAAAVRWTNERGLGQDDEVSYPREPEHLVLARVLLAQDLPDRALALLDRLHALAAAQGRTGSVIEIQALQAVALAAAGEQAGAVAALAETLTLAHPQGYVRVFADEGAPMSALLGRLVAAQRSDRNAAGGVPLAYLGRLLRAFGDKATPGAPPSRGRGVGIPGLVEALSERELEVLRLVAAGKPNREIAAELYVALDTVKKHLTHIFEKLGAANRTQATARARELGLLADAAEPPTTSRP
jgi:LuxR family transcriptional regulator, maltose regulon positive regulatory protein